MHCTGPSTTEFEDEIHDAMIPDPEDEEQEDEQEDEDEG